MEEHSVPGLALAVVQGDSIGLAAWGSADAAASVPVTPDTPFRLASAAKVLVAATALIEADEGRLDLHADVEPVVGFPLDGAFRGPVTIHHLLTHTAGFDERVVGYAARTSNEMRPLGDYLSDRMPDRGWPIGEILSYSNHGMSLAAYAVERAAERSFAQVADSELFRPLAMAATRFLTSGESIPGAAAEPLECLGRECSPLPHLYSHAYPAGLAFSTARDMGAFVSAVLSSEETGSPLADLIPERFSHDARLPGMSYAFFNQAYAGRRILAHSGSVPGYWSLLLLVPEENVGFFFVTNGGDSEFGAAFRDQLLEGLVGPQDKDGAAARRGEDPAIRAGAYELTRYSHGTIERFPQLFHNALHLRAREDTLLVMGGGPAQRFLQIGDSLYQEVGGDGLLAFGTRRGKPFLFRSSDVYGAELPAAYERLGSRSSPSFMNEYVSWLLALPILMMILTWPILLAGGYLWRKRRGQEGPGFELMPLLAALTATATIGLFAWFGFGFVARSNQLFQTGEMFFGMPDSLAALTWIPWAHLTLSLALLAAVPWAWRKRWWDLARRATFTVTVAILVLQVSFLAAWNYLPAVW
jgi:CubicO group peptidase (beta-lactamase class C family)